MRTIFSKEEIAEFNKHPCVFHCSERSIHYTYEFKKRALELHSQGISPREIWKRSGFNTDRWKYNYTYSTIKDWKRIVAKKGIDGFEDLKPKEKTEYLKKLDGLTKQSFYAYFAGLNRV